MPELNLATTETHSWEEVEDSVTRACKALEALAAADKAATPGFTGKLRSRFRSLCSHAGAGSTLSQMVPSDSYFSVLAGGLKVIFKALEQTGLYRQEVYAALEELPFILNDNAALLELHGQDEELHRRIAGLYAAIYKFMDVIISWFLKPSLGKLLSRFTRQSYEVKLVTDMPPATTQKSREPRYSSTRQASPQSSRTPSMASNVQPNASPPALPSCLHRDSST